ncbi:hypothetical protein B9Z55_007113 [Caenorhabditis nigoni]|uniref:BTB domain-containing protein n=1 Tax=Caenorhabditis nigoni TaxID=1611254 RepID=A0A2G5V833_9PELO|nr:hypothetical protein B9Z55_007113 [Caenorhabditis nigoni]
MANNEKIETVVENEVVEKLKIVVAAETEEIKNSQKRKFDEISEKLQQIEGSVSKMSKLEKSIVLNNQNKKELKSGKGFVLKHTFVNVTNLKEGDRAISQTEEHFNLEWYMVIHSSKSHIGLYVCCKPDEPVEKKYAIETKIEFRMMGPDDNKVSKTKRHCFENNKRLAYNGFMKWKEMKQDYLIDDRLTIEVDVEILKMSEFEKERNRKFDESQKDVSDVILVVQSTKFYVLKMYLALQSSYFKSLFLGNFDESQKNEIELKDINSDDFQNFLELIHGESSIDDSTVSGILHLAEMYDAPTAIRRCEEFLLKNSQKDTAQKLQLALRYNLENLKSKCLTEINTIPDIESILAANLPEMNVSTAEALLHKCIAFSKK